MVKNKASMIVKALGPKDLESLLIAEKKKAKREIIKMKINSHFVGDDIHPGYNHYAVIDPHEIITKEINESDLRSIVRAYKKAGWKRVEVERLALGNMVRFTFIP